MYEGPFYTFPKQYLGEEPFLLFTHKETDRHRVRKIKNHKITEQSIPLSSARSSDIPPLFSLSITNDGWFISYTTGKKLVHLSKVNGALQPGDHIAVPIIPSCKVNRPWHHGIYIGEEDSEFWVIHMNGHDKASATIYRDPLELFCRQASHIAIIKYMGGYGRDIGC